MNLTQLINNGKREKARRLITLEGELRHQANVAVDVLTIKLSTFPLKENTLFNKEF